MERLVALVVMTVVAVVLIFPTLAASDLVADLVALLDSRLP